MARPSKNNCDYFPHLTTMRNHKKVKAIRNKFGQVLGYAFWAMILEYLTEQDGNEFEFSTIEIEMFAGELGVSAAEIQDMINFCMVLELLFITEDNFIYSDSLNESLKPVYEKRNKSKDLSKTRKRRDNGSFCDENSQTTGVSATETPQSKVEYSKVNKSKVNIRDAAKAATQKRISVFKESLYPFTKNKGGLYTAEMVKEFFEYWSELNKSETKMLWELKPTFQIAKRLANWAKNEKPNKQQLQTNIYKTTD